MHGILLHSTIFRFEVATQDGVRASVVVKILRVDAERIFVREPVEIVLSQISGDIICVTILVEVGCGKAIPPACKLLKTRIGNFLKSFPCIFEDCRSHELSHDNEIRFSVVVVITPEAVSDHPGELQRRGYLLCNI